VRRIGCIIEFVKHHVSVSFLGLLVFALGTRGLAQPSPAPRVLPFRVGEELTYHATFARFPAGTARMRVESVDTVRGKPAFHLVFTLDGGIIGFRVHDRYDSWIDTLTLSALRYKQQISEGRYHRNTTYEIFPELAKYRKDSDSLRASVDDPLDDGSFIYAVRVAGIKLGEIRTFDRYFIADRNPVTLTGVQYDTVEVDAGSFFALQVHPTIKARGIFSEGGDAQIWITEDALRIPVKVSTKFSHFSLVLSLSSMKLGTEQR
jgi:uncharacterized protein DUF3108